MRGIIAPVPASLAAKPVHFHGPVHFVWALLVLLVRFLWGILWKLLQISMHVAPDAKCSAVALVGLWIWDIQKVSEPFILKKRDLLPASRCTNMPSQGSHPFLGLITKDILHGGVHEDGITPKFKRFNTESKALGCFSGDARYTHLKYLWIDLTTKNPHKSESAAFPPTGKLHAFV